MAKLTEHLAQAEHAAAAIRRHWTDRARVGLVLGTGLGNLAGHMAPDVVIPFEHLPHFPRPTALSHAGQLVCGRLGDVPTLTMEGRCHLYEGYSADDVTLPIRVMHALGAELLIVSNASGGLNTRFASGDVMVVTDHINLMGPGPWPAVTTRTAWRAGRSAAAVYDPQLIDRAVAIARRENFVAHRGVYVGVRGPNYETRAEYRFLRAIGGDAVGMSTVPEVHVAADHDMRVLALSTITNVARPDAPQVVEAGEVVDAAAHAEPKVRRIVLGIVAEFAGC